MQIAYRFTTNHDDMDLDVIHGFLVDSYWARGMPRRLLQRALNNSFCFGVILDDTLIAFGRFITDYATFAYMADVFVVPEYRGKGVSTYMMAEVLRQPEVQGLRRMLLVTRDAHGLYQKFGFKAVEDCSQFMQQVNPDIYLNTPTSTKAP